MDLNEFSDQTKNFITNIRERVKANIYSTPQSSAGRIKLIILMNERLKDKENRVPVLRAIVGKNISSSKDLYNEELYIIIDTIEKTQFSMAIIQEIEDWCELNKNLPGGAIPTEYYTLAERKVLSAILAYRRKEFSPEFGNVVTCFECGLPITDGLGDLHEGFITRGQVAKSPNKDAIYTKYNCAHRHNECPDGEHSHTPGIGGDETLKRFTAYIVKWEKYQHVLKWLESMADLFEEAGQEALNRFLENTKHG